MKTFDDSDSVYIFNLSNSCEIKKYGYASHEDDDLIIVWEYLQARVFFGIIGVEIEPINHILFMVVQSKLYIVYQGL